MWDETRDFLMPFGCCFRLVAVALACLIGSAAAGAAQEPVEQFYRGKQINIVVGSSAGGGYYTYARLIARATAHRSRETRRSSCRT